ncbi:MAG: hypothetical protein ABEJ23_01090 [Haloarculaceae archaeon]
MTQNLQDTIETFIGNLVDRFYEVDHPGKESRQLAPTAMTAVRTLHDAKGKRVVSRSEVIEQMAAEGNRPGNFDDVLDELKRFGVLLPVTRFADANNHWYLIDEAYLGWVGEVLDQPNQKPLPADERTEAIALYLQQSIAAGEAPAPVDAWLYGVCRGSGYAAFDVESISFSQLNKRKTDDGWQHPRPDGYLLEPYIQTDGWGKTNCVEQICHVEVVGRLSPIDEELYRTDVRESFALLPAAADYDGTDTFDLSAQRADLLHREPISADEWQKKTGTGAVDEYAELAVEIDDSTLRASAYRGRFE